MKRLLAFTILCGISLPVCAQQTNHINAAFAAEYATLDPTKFIDGKDRDTLAQIYEQLVKPDPKLKRLNWLAESWEIGGTESKPTIDIQLRKGVKFHNGYPLTSADFEFSFQRARDPKISRTTFLQANVERFEIVDDHHFRLHFKAPDAMYIAENLVLWAVSKRYFEEVGDEAAENHPVGTGPWKFISRKRGDEVKLEAFSDYWNTEHRPKAGTLTIKYIPEDTTRLAAFKTGAVDWISTVPSQAIAEVKAMPGVETVSKASGGHPTIQFSTHLANSPFVDLRVRQAVAHAVDWPAIIKTVLFGQGVAYAELAPDDFGYDPSLVPYRYDVRKSRELLSAAGFPNGFETPCYNLITPREPNFKEMGEAVFAYLSAVGIRCKARGMEYSAWVALARRGREGSPEMDGLFMMTWGVGVPGDLNRAWLNQAHSFDPKQNLGSFSYVNDPKLDELVIQQNRIMDPAKRVEVVQKIARYKYENILGGLTTYVPSKTFAWRNDKIEYTAWPWPGNWHDLLEIGLRK